MLRNLAMKTFVINLERAERRRKYIVKHLTSLGIDFKIINAIDGNNLTENDIHKYADIERVKQSPYWLTKGAIACALSHRLAYQELISENEDYALIIEDDVQLPKNINTILEEIGNAMTTRDVTLLYYTSFTPTFFSTIGQKKLSIGGLYYPMEIHKPTTAAAYIIGKDAASKLISKILPIRVAADCWGHFYEWECFESFMVHYPSAVKTMNFKSSIDYHDKRPFLAKFLSAIDKYKIPIAYQLIKYRRKRNLNKMLNHFSLTDEVSPIYIDVQKVHKHKSLSHQE